MPDKHPHTDRGQPQVLRNPNQRDLLERKRPSIDQADAAYKTDVLIPRLSTAIADKKPGYIATALASAYFNYLDILSTNVYQEPRDHNDRDRISLYNYLATEKRTRLFSKGLPDAMAMFRNANPSYPIPKFLGNKEQLNLEISLREDRGEERRTFLLRPRSFAFIESEISSAESRLHSYFNTFVTAVNENNPAEVKRVFDLLNIRGILSTCEKSAWSLFESRVADRIGRERIGVLRVKFINAFRMAALLYGYFSPIFESYENTLITPGLLREKANDFMIAVAKIRRGLPEYTKLLADDETADAVSNMLVELSKVNKEDVDAVANKLHEEGIVTGLEDLSASVSAMYRKLRDEEAFREYMHAPTSILQKNSAGQPTVLGHELADLNDTYKLPSQEIVRGLIQINDSNLLGIKARRLALEYINELIRASLTATGGTGYSLTNREIADLDRLTPNQRATLLTLQEAGILQKQMQDAMKDGPNQVRPLIIAKTLYGEAKMQQKAVDQGATTNAALGRLSVNKGDPSN